MQLRPLVLYWFLLLSYHMAKVDNFEYCPDNTKDDNICSAANLDDTEITQVTNFENSYDIDTIYDQLITKVISFEEVRAKIKDSLGGTVKGKHVAFRMFDASTKIPSGVAVWSAFDLGNFDECYAIEHGDIYGKYCLGIIPMDSHTKKYWEILRGIKRPLNMTMNQPRLLELGKEYTGFHFAVCVPSTWSVAQIPSSLQFSEDFCYSKATEQGLSNGALITLVVLSTFLVIIVVSTLYDIYLYYSKEETPNELFLAFSFVSNGRKIFRSTTNPDQLLCLSGIRFLSFMWIMIAHEYALGSMIAPSSNFLFFAEWDQGCANLLTMAAHMAVESFLVVGGVVSVYTFVKSVDNGVKFNVIQYWLHRYLRLTPTVIILALIHTYLVNHFGNGPLWKIVDLTLVKSCESAWWSTFLYISNYVQAGMCVTQTWYLTVDMQLFILSPLVLIPLSKWPKIGLTLLGCLTIAGSIVPSVVSYTAHLGSMMSDNTARYLSVYYIQTYARFGPYVIGMILGFFLYKIRKSATKVKLPQISVFILWMVCLTALGVLVHASYVVNFAFTEDRLINAIYLALSKPVWAAALSGIIFLCVSGYGGPINGFLSLPIFQFLNKLSYSMYLVHYTVLTIKYSAMRNTVHFSALALMHNFWGDFMFTLALSIISSLSFELPFIVLEKHLFRSFKLQLTVKEVKFRTMTSSSSGSARNKARAVKMFN